MVTVSAVAWDTAERAVCSKVHRLIMMVLVVVVMMMIYFLLLLFSWDYLPINSILHKAEVNNSWTYISSPPYAFEAGAEI
jgi:hypothetical protein